MKLKSTSIGTPARPCFNIFSNAKELMYTVSDVSTWFESCGVAERPAPIAPPRPKPAIR
uniref:Uncharacterized protein n=1 Tax=Meloidogyne incognita TaxID=6306 RepID=A0A914LF25_MELIC